MRHMLHFFNRQGHGRLLCVCLQMPCYASSVQCIEASVKRALSARVIGKRFSIPFNLSPIPSHGAAVGWGVLAACAAGVMASLGAAGAPVAAGGALVAAGVSGGMGVDSGVWVGGGCKFTVTFGGS